MAKLDLPAIDEISAETDELAWELQQARPDTHRIRWLIEDRGADVRGALAKAALRETDLQKKPALRPLHLEKHLQGR